MTVQIDLGQPLPQHMLALAEANRVRLARAELKENVASGGTPVRDVILDPPGCAETMAVMDLLLAQRMWGRARALRVLRGTFISERRQLGRLTMRERCELIGRLEWD